MIKAASSEDWMFKPKYFYSLAAFHDLKRMYFEKSRDILKAKKYSANVLFVLFEAVYTDFLEEFSFTCYIPVFNKNKETQMDLTLLFRQKQVIDLLKRNFPQSQFVHIID